jgi:hypothetical protein
VFLGWGRGRGWSGGTDVGRGWWSCVTSAAQLQAKAEAAVMWRACIDRVVMVHCMLIVPDACLITCLYPCSASWLPPRTCHCVDTLCGFTNSNIVLVSVRLQLQAKAKGTPVPLRCFLGAPPPPLPGIACSNIVHLRFPSTVAVNVCACSYKPRPRAPLYPCSASWLPPWLQVTPAASLPLACGTSWWQTATTASNLVSRGAVPALMRPSITTCLAKLLGWQLCVRLCGGRQQGRHQGRRIYVPYNDSARDISMHRCKCSPDM